MNKKAESVYTSRIINQNAHQARKAARMARRQARALQNYAVAAANADVFYVSVNGISAPVCR
ncbi:hypothetical protein AALD01_08525 [Oscillospiraceae bacterium 21-37]|jgi:hypothetical protein|uniref:hypothetical protein n=1 Tax=Eubacteriales TaxID=186802 RepID=UPI00136B7D91|nr:MULTISPECIES: hypothetical protein [unclassified Neglectibacter]MCI8395897.1 hypothetical protein [Acutalibacter sp.]MCI8920594.1 hypothetical protein [Acutalibacter sp.]MCI9116651.1 hypothetical protein [Acutalibacter sp.]NBI17073.1 hypothetical protein [Neglectibacter sp. 59]NBJ72485.1 hypothetical protein [Neglectibacter sp. X4]